MIEVLHRHLVNLLGQGLLGISDLARPQEGNAISWQVTPASHTLLEPMKLAHSFYEVDN